MATTEQQAPLVVCDAGPLIHLDEVGCLDLLADFSEVLVPEVVWVEVLKHRPGALAHAEVYCTSSLFVNLVFSHRLASPDSGTWLRQARRWIMKNRNLLASLNLWETINHDDAGYNTSAFVGRESLAESPLTPGGMLGW